MPKTSFIMLRPLLDSAVRQRTSDGFISATDLLRAGNTYRLTHGMPLREIADYFQTKETQEFIEQVKMQEHLPDVKHATRGRNGSTWVHPVVALDFALWLSPALKYEVYKWMTDQLLLRRMDSADSFKAMNKALDTRYDIGSKYWWYVNAANKVKAALGVEDWNTATEAQLIQRDKVQDYVIMLCEETTHMTPTSVMDTALARVLGKT